MLVTPLYDSLHLSHPHIQVVLSTKDFTPESERQRIQQLAASQPHLLGDEFSPLQYLRRNTSKDLGEPIYYRDHNMQVKGAFLVTMTIGIVPVTRVFSVNTCL